MRNYQLKQLLLRICENQNNNEYRNCGMLKYLFMEIMQYFYY